MSERLIQVNHYMPVEMLDGNKRTSMDLEKKKLLDMKQNN